MSAYIGDSPPSELALPVSRTNHRALRWKTASQAWGADCDACSQPRRSHRAAAERMEPRGHHGHCRLRGDAVRERLELNPTELRAQRGRDRICQLREDGNPGDELIAIARGGAGDEQARAREGGSERAVYSAMYRPDLAG